MVNASAREGINEAKTLKTQGAPQANGQAKTKPCLPSDCHEDGAKTTIPAFSPALSTRTTIKPSQNTTEPPNIIRKNHPKATCTRSVSLSAQAKFLSQNEVGTSMRRCLRDFYAVGSAGARLRPHGLHSRSSVASRRAHRPARRQRQTGPASRPGTHLSKCG